jgi:hypothetical protein
MVIPARWVVRERAAGSYGSGSPESGVPGSASFGSESRGSRSPRPEPSGLESNPPDSSPHPPFVRHRAPAARTQPVPDPFEDAQALEDLGHEIVTIFANVHAANHRGLILLAEFHRRRGYELEGHRSTAHWLHFRTGIDLGAAREKVRASLALTELPQISEAMGRGELSFSKVRALTRVATPETEGELLSVAREMTTAELEKCIRAWRHISRDEEAKLEKVNYRRRRFSVVPDESGAYVVRGVVTPEVGALLMRAVEAASDALFNAEAKEETTPEQRRADALGLLAERAMAAGFGGEENVSAETSGRTDGNPAPLSGTHAERYQVVLHLDPATLSPRGQPGRSNLEDGTRVSAETSRRLCCDSSVVKVLRGPDGEVLDVGRRTRTIPPAIRRALEVRDGGCRWPGCGLRFTAAHHVEHWAEGGDTRLGNLLLLCAFHHRKVHEGGWKALYNEKDDTALFFGPKGVLRYTRRGVERITSGSAVSLIESNRARGVTPDGWTPTARAHAWGLDSMELELRAWEALDREEPDSRT